MWQKYQICHYLAIVVGCICCYTMAFLIKVSWGMKRFITSGALTMGLIFFLIWIWWLTGGYKVLPSPGPHNTGISLAPLILSSMKALWSFLFMDENFSPWKFRLIPKLWPHWLLSYQNIESKSLPGPRAFLAYEIAENSFLCRFVVYDSF